MGLPTSTPDRVTLLYERAIAAAAVDATIWSDYLSYMVETKLSASVLQVAACFVFCFCMNIKIIVLFLCVLVGTCEVCAQLPVGCIVVDAVSSLR
jgi:hypothetical protein